MLKSLSKFVELIMAQLRLVNRAWIRNSMKFLLHHIMLKSRAILYLLFSHSFATPWRAAHQASLFFTISRSLLKLMSIESVMPFNNLVLCHPLLLPSIFPNSGSFLMSQLLPSGGQSIGFSVSISPSNEHPGLISFRMDWFNLLAVQGTLKSLLQHHSSKASVLWHSAVFMVQLSHPYMSPGKTIALTIDAIQ